MNRIYKVIFNTSLGLYQVVSEIARNHGKSSSSTGRKAALVPFVLSALLGFGLSGTAMAADPEAAAPANGAVTMKEGDQLQLQGTGAASVSSKSQTDETSGKTTTTITVAVPTNGEVTKDNTGLVTGGTVYTAVNAEQTARETADTTLTNKIGTLDTQVKTNADAISKETTDREKAVTNVTNTVNTLSDSAVKYDDDSNKGKVTLAGKGGTTISNVKDGTLNDSSTDAVTGKQLYAEQSARTAADTAITNKIGALSANGNYIQKDASVSSNLSTLDIQVKTNADAISKETTDRETAVSDEATARTNAINALETKLTSGSDNSLVSKANVNAANIGNNLTVADGTSDDAKKATINTNLEAWGEALGAGAIASGDVKLLSGGTLFTELRPSADGTYSYISSKNTTAVNLKSLDSAIAALGVEMLTDKDGKPIQYTSSLFKYFKVNPEFTTNDDGTKTYAPDAAANGTNSVAIGPSAKVNTTGENGVAIGKGATTGADKYTKTLTDKTTTEVSAAGGVDSVSIGTNAASQGNDSVALGKGAQVLNDFDSSTNAAVVKTGDVAIGSGATVDSSLDSTAIGTSADVRYGENSLALGSSAKVDTAKQAVALGYKASVADGADGSLALGDEASAKSSYATAIGYKASANTASSIAMGNGANTGGDGGGIAIGTSTTADGRSIAIGFSGTTTANNYDSVAIGNGAQANVDRSISIGLNAGTGAKADKGGNEGSLIAIGDAAGQNVAGLQNTAIGSGAGSGVKSSNNIALGSYAGSNITNVSDNNPQNGYNISIGYQANYSKTNQTIIDSLAIGRETSAITNGVALGATAKASGQNSVSLGFKAQSSGTDSMALGSGASAADGNVAIGSSSAAPAVSTLGTVKDDGNVYKAETSTDSSGAVKTTYTLYKSALTNIPLSSTSHYVSFGISDGNTTVNRRLSNVADGVFDQDAVTVKQLNTAYSSLQGLIKGIDTSTLNTYSTDVIDSKEANLKAEIANSKYKYFSVNADSATSTGNQDNTGASSGGADAMAIGPNAYATATKSLAVGNNVSASGVHSIALGTSDNPTTTAGATTTHYTSSEGENSIAVGYAAIAQTDNSIAIGTRAVTYTADTSSRTPTKTGINSIAIGYETVTRKDYATAIGNSASAKGTESTALGNKTTAEGTESLAVGSQSTTNGDGSASIGRSNTVTGTDVAAVGSGNISSGSWGGITDSGLFGYTNKIQAYSDTNVSNTVTGVYALGSNNEVDQANKINKVTNVTLLGQGNIVTAGSNATSYQNTINNVTVIGGSNTVKGYEQPTTSWSTLENDTVLGYGNTIDASQQATPVSNIQILGNKVTAALGNSVYLGTAAAYVSAVAASNDAETLAVQHGDADAEASDEYKAAATDTERNTIKQKYEAKHLYKARVAAMEASGTTAGVNQYDQDNTYGNASSYTYAAGTSTGVITVGSVGSERRIQNVAAGLVSATSTDAVNGSQLYALTRQIRFGGDNSSFGKTTAAEDQNVVARGSNETISITGGSDAVTSSTADGTTTYTVDAAKLTDNNIAVVANKNANALHVQLASNLKDLNTAQLGTGSGESYKETIKLDGTGANGGQMTLAGADGTVKTTLDTTGLTIANGPKFTSSGIDAANQQIHRVTAGTDNTDAANVGQVNAAAAEATTEVKAGTNASLGTVETSATDKHKIYTVNVDNLAVKANGTGTTTVALANGINFKNGTNTTSAVDSNGNVTIDTKNLALKANGTNTASVTMDGGINFKDGTNTTAAVDSNGTVTISATHNKLSTVSAATGDNDNVTLTLTDADGNTVTSTGLKNTYTTVTKDGTAHTVTFARNDGKTQTLSLGDLDGASTEALNKAAAKATSEVTNGTNVASVTKTAGTNGQNIYTVNVDDLAVKTTSGEKKSVHLADGLVFADGTNTTATVGDNGTIKFNVSDAAIKKQAVQAVNVTGDNKNVTVTPVTNADGTLETFTVTATHNKLNAKGTATQATADSNAVTLTLQDSDGNTTTTGLTDTYTTVSKDGTNKKVTFKRNDGETQTLDLNDLGGITAAQDKYITGGTVSYDTKGNGTAALTGNNGLTASITGLKDTKVSSGVVTYAGTQGDASGSATLTMNDGSKATISGLKDDYITSAAVGTETNHVTMTRLGGSTVDLNLNPILEKYSLSDYHLVGAGTTHDQAYAVDSNGTVTLNVVDDKNPTGTPKTIQITGLASQTGVNAGRTTVKSSDSSIAVSDSAPNSDTHTYDIKVDYTKIPANLRVQYSGDKGTAGSNTMDKATAFSGTTGQIVTTAENGKVSFKLANDISGINSVTTGDFKLDTNGLTVTGGPSVLKSGINAGSRTISNVGDAAEDTDAATLGQVKKARTVVAKGNNVKDVTPVESTDGTHQVTYTVNVDNLSVKANTEAAKSVTLNNGLTFNNGTNTTASVGSNGEVKYDLNSTLTGLTSVTAGNSTLDTNGLTISGGPKFTKNGIDAGSQRITGVADGENANDAINKSQLDALQNQVSGGWNLVGNNAEGTAVTAKIGAGKTVTYGDGNYTKSVVTKDDSTGNATVKVDVTTGTFGSGTGDKAGTVISTTNGLATTQDVASAINSASISVVADNTPENKTAVKAGDTIHFAKDENLTLTQNGTTFTYGLNKEISISKVTTSDTTKGSTVQTAEGVTTTDAAGNTYIQNGQGITLTPSDKTKSPVKLTNTGLNNGGNKITGVGKGTDDTDAVNVAQLKEVNNKVGSGWQLVDNNGTKVADIGAGKKVSFKTDSQYLTAKTETTGTDAANVTYGLKTKALTATDGKVSSVETAEDGLATAKNVAETINQTYWTMTSGQTGTGKATGTAVSNVTAGTAVTLQAGNNLLLNQAGNSFTYALNPVVTGMTSISFTGMGTGSDGKTVNDLVIGLQNGGGANPNRGYYITGLSNTEWNQSNYQGDRAATEAQLKKAIENVSIVKGGGGYGLTADEGANNGGDKNVTQALGSTIAVRGDGTYDENGKLVKAGNVKTVAYTDTAGSGQTGAIQIQLNKDINLGADGSLQAGGVTLKNNSVTVGTNGVVISNNGTERTVSNLSNIRWDTAKASQEASAGGYINSTKAATESQLQQAISQVTTTAQNNEQHIQIGEYTIGKNLDGTDRTDTHSVSMDVVDGQGKKQGSVVIKDVAKASEVGDVSQLHDTLKNSDGTKNVTGAINNLDDRVTGLDTRMDQIYTTAGQHSSVSAENNIQVDSQSKNGTGGTDYKLSLNKEKIDLKNVTIEGNAGAVTAKTVTVEKYNVGDKTYISSDGLNANNQKITNVQTGIVDTDAANVGQVRAADEQLAGGIEQNAAHISQLGQAVNKLDNRINRVGAGAAALAALHPGDYDPDDKLDVSAGVGNYRGANAAAVGLFFHPNERTILSVAGSMGGGENMVNAGVTLKVGPGHGTPTTVTTKTGQKVDVMDILAKQTEILEKLAGNTKAASAPAGSDIFPDVPQNHWAYAYVDKLYRAGSLAGFSEPGKLKSHMLTRKDFAEILYWAMTNGATTNPDLNGDGSLNRLAAEFGAELKLVVK